MESVYLEQSERLGPYRIALFVLAGVLAVGATIPWALGVREQRRLRMHDYFAQDAYRMQQRGRDLMRSQLEENLPAERAEFQKEVLGLDRPSVMPVPPEPREIHYAPPMPSVAVYLFAASALFAADGVRRRQLALIQAVSDARRRAREAAEQAERDAAPAPPADA